MPFLTDDVPVLIHPDGVYELVVDLDYRGKTDLISVPEGFRTDLASVPRFLSWLAPIAGTHNRAAILHDRNCVEQAEAYRENRRPQINSTDTDGLFLRCLREAGVHPYRARAYWVGVRYGALKNPARRAGWLSTAPAVLLWTLLLLPVLPAALGTGLTLLVGRVVREVVEAFQFLVRGKLPAWNAVDAEQTRRHFAERRSV